MLNRWTKGSRKRGRLLPKRCYHYDKRFSRKLSHVINTRGVVGEQINVEFIPVAHHITTVRTMLSIASSGTNSYGIGDLISRFTWPASPKSNSNSTGCAQLDAECRIAGDWQVHFEVERTPDSFENTILAHGSGEVLNMLCVVGRRSSSCRLPGDIHLPAARSH